MQERENRIDWDGKRDEHDNCMDQWVGRRSRRMRNEGYLV